jgi:hypothetical protein
MTTTIPTVVWYSGALALTACTSALVLSIQRGLHHKQIRLNERSSIEIHLKQDTKRDLSVPYADTNRLTRITCCSLFLATMAAFNLQADVKHAQEDQSRIWYIASSMFIFVSWLYASVLALLSRRYQLPNAWGWILNVHLCIIYFVAWFVSLYQLWQVVLIQSPNISWLDCLPFLLPVLLGFDLIYVTSTTKQGPPFLDENDRQVCNINVESIIGYLYLNWCSNIVSVVAKKKADLMDEDLPVMTAQFRAHNIFYTFGATRGKELISRLITANKPKIIIQFSLSVVASALYYAPAFFMNRLLQFLQDYNAGVSFDHPMQYAILIVIGMGVSIVVMGIFVSQQWYFGKLVHDIHTNTCC